MTAVPDFLQSVHCPSLQAAHRYSQLRLQELARQFEEHSDALQCIETIAVGGSLGRLEAGADSDIDCIIVLRDAAAASDCEVEVALIHELFAHSPFKPSKRDGIYRHGVRRAALLDRAALGSLSEAPDVFGKRIQLLLDARPVFACERLEVLQGAILDWYGSDFIAASPSRGWTYLSNDLTRYLHSYAGWQQFKFNRVDDDSWQLRQAKFRSSRLLTFAALMFLLGESDHDADKIAWLRTRLTLTPLQRLHFVMGAYDGPLYDQLLDGYEASFAALADSAVRTTLVRTGPDAERRMAATLDPAYLGIKHASAVIARVLTEFALARRADWGARFFERWLF